MTGIVTPEQLHDHAQNLYRESVDNGRPLTVQELADHYGRTETWAHHIIQLATQTHHEPAIVDASIDITNDLANDASPARIAYTTEVPAHRTRARGISVTALLAGITVSIAGNVLHAQAVSTNLAAWLVAAFWPIALFLAVKVITRVQWPRGVWYALARYGGTGIVATVAGIVSYRHMAGLLTHWGEDAISAHLGPLAIDGLVVVAATALVAMNKPTEGPHQ